MMVCWALWLAGGEDNSGWGMGKGGFSNAILFEPHTALSQAGQTPVTHSSLLWKLMTGPVSWVWGEIENLMGLSPSRTAVPPLLICISPWGIGVGAIYNKRHTEQLMLLGRREILATEDPYHTRGAMTRQKGLTWSVPRLSLLLLNREGSGIIYSVSPNSLVPHFWGGP